MQKRRQKHGDQQTARRGTETLEVVLTLPILLIATIAAFEFGFILLVQQAVTTAAIEGAREGGKDGTTAEATTLEVSRVLAIHNLTLTASGSGTSDDVRVLIERYGAATVESGNPAIRCSAKNGATLQPGQVRVTVCVTMSNSENRPVPDWLKSLGFSLAGRTFEVSAVAIDE